MSPLPLDIPPVGRAPEEERCGWTAMLVDGTVTWRCPAGRDSAIHDSLHHRDKELLGAHRHPSPTCHPYVPLPGASGGPVGPSRGVTLMDF